MNKFFIIALPIAAIGFLYQSFLIIDDAQKIDDLKEGQKNMRESVGSLLDYAAANTNCAVDAKNLFEKLDKNKYNIELKRSETSNINGLGSNITIKFKKDKIYEIIAPSLGKRNIPC